MNTVNAIIKIIDNITLADTDEKKAKAEIENKELISNVILHHAKNCEEIKQFQNKKPT